MIYKKIQNTPHERVNILHQSLRWDGIFTDEEVDKIANYCNALEKQSGQISGDGLINGEMRKSNVAFIRPDANTAWIFNKINNAIEIVNDRFFNFDLNGYSAIQYSEYHGDEGGKYEFHMDTFTGYENKEPEMRKLSLVMMLNKPGEDFEGGEFQINKAQESKPDNIEMIKGRMIFFPSFFIHRVAPVTKGVRRSLVIWVTGPKFR
jgi:PKHD-type hydroxylase